MAVSVTAARDAVEQEMQARGVLPDLLYAHLREKPQRVSHFGPDAKEVHAETPDSGAAWLGWRVEDSPAKWMHRLDAIAIECLAEDRQAARWIRLGPRYFGRAVQGQRVLYCDEEPANEIVRRFRDAVRSGDIKTKVSVSLCIHDETRVFQFNLES